MAGAVLCEPPCADLVAGTALYEPPCALCAALAACQGVGCTPWRRLGTGALPVAFACCVRRLLLAKGSDVRPGVGWAPALDVQISWQAQHFVNLHVQISWQAQYFVNLRAQISWQARRFVNLHVHCVRHLLFLWSWKLRTGDVVVQLQYAEQSGELEAENWRLCSTTLVRGVSGELEDEN